MGVQMDEVSQISATDLTNSESVGEAAIILIAVGSMLIILSAAIVYGLRRRKYMAKGPALVESVPNSTDFMNSLATWDRCHSIEEMLEKKRRSVWTLHSFDNLNRSGANSENKTYFET